jgi:hypothetical protein
MCWWKIGATSNLLRRLDRLGAVEYGSVLQTLDGFETEPGFDHWTLQRLAAAFAPVGPAIEMQPEGILMQLPPRMTISQFEARLRIALESVSLQKFYGTAAGLD